MKILFFYVLQIIFYYKKLFYYHKHIFRLFINDNFFFLNFNFIFIFKYFIIFIIINFIIHINFIIIIKLRIYQNKFNHFILNDYPFIYMHIIHYKYFNKNMVIFLYKIKKISLNHQILHKTHHLIILLYMH